MQYAIIPYKYNNQIKFNPDDEPQQIDIWTLKINLMIQNLNYALLWISFSNTLICKEISSKRIESEIQTLCKQIGGGYVRLNHYETIPQSIANITVDYIMVKPHIYTDIHYNYYDKRYTNPPPHSPKSLGVEWKRKYWEIEKEEIIQELQYKMDVDTQ